MTSELKKITYISLGIVLSILFSSCDYVPIVSYDSDLKIEERKQILDIAEAYNFEREEKINDKKERDELNKKREEELFKSKSKTLSDNKIVGEANETN